MRVLCITHHSDRPEAETFIGLKKRGVDLEVLCPPDAPHYKRLTDAGVPVIDMMMKSRIQVNHIVNIRRRIKEKNFQILHLFNNYAVSNGIAAATGLPVKIVAYRGIEGNVGMLNPESWFTYLNPKVDCIICVAEAVRQYFLKMKLPWGRFPEHKVLTVYKGHSLDWYQDRPENLTQFGIPENAFVVGCVANLRPRKGVHVLIDAAKYFPENAPIHFLLVGNMDSPELKKQIEISPFYNKIHMTGFRKNAPALMASCDTFVLPAIKREGLPKTVIEAMAYGVAPIVTDSGGSPELIEANKSGLIVPSGDSQAIADAILKFYEDANFCKIVGENARLRIDSSFRIEDTIDKTFTLYQSLVNDIST